MAIGYVRPAHESDAARIAEIQLSTWRTAYHRLLPRHVLDELDEQWMTQRWHEAIGQPPSAAHRVLVAIEQSAQSYLLGFAASGPADESALAPQEPPDTFLAGRALPGRASGPDVAAITDLLVEPRWQRRGHGSRLLSACMEGWQADGMRAAVAWAYEADQAMIKFLSSAGWAPDGAGRALDVEDLLVPQVRLHVAVEAPDA